MWGGAGNDGNGSIDLNGPSAHRTWRTTRRPGRSSTTATTTPRPRPRTSPAPRPVTRARATRTTPWDLRMGDQVRRLRGGHLQHLSRRPAADGGGFRGQGRQLPRREVDTAYGGYAGGGDAHNAPDHVATTVTAAAGCAASLPCHPSTSHLTTTSVLRANVSVAFRAPPMTPRAARPLSRPAADLRRPPARTSAATAGRRRRSGKAASIGVATQCTACHAAEPAASQAAASQWNSAFSGLHARAGSVSLENHIATDGSVGDLQDSSAARSVTRCRRCTSRGWTSWPRTRSPTRTS